MNVSISVTIITKNEIENIEACLLAAQEVADEIVVVDSFSTDGTQAFCRSRGAKVIEQAFAGYVEQKNTAVQAAKFDHILSLDADEVLSETLIKSILSVKQNFQAEAYRFNRLNNYCGKWIRHGGWYPDQKIRLFDRKKARWGGGRLHEHIVVDEKVSVGYLKGDLLHYTYKSISDHVQRIDSYTNIMATDAAMRSKSVSLFKLIVGPIWLFWQRYLFKLGFLDGYAGLVLAVMSAYYKFLKYAKIRAASVS